MSSDLLKITILQLPTILQPRTRDSNCYLPVIFSVWYVVCWKST